MMTTFWTPYSFMAVTTLALLSAMSRGGDIGAAKGLSEARGAFSVTMTTSGMRSWKACLTSETCVGDPEIVSASV
jgi:hypothetical protein